MRISDWSSDVCSSDLLKDRHPTTSSDRKGGTSITPSFISARKKRDSLPFAKSISCSIQPKSASRLSAGNSQSGSGASPGISANSASNSRAPRHGGWKPCPCAERRLNTLVCLARLTSGPALETGEESGRGGGGRYVKT